LTVDELILEVFKCRLVDLELPLESAVGQASTPPDTRMNVTQLGQAGGGGERRLTARPGGQTPGAFGSGLLQTLPHGGRPYGSSGLRLREYLARRLAPRSPCATPGTRERTCRRAAGGVSTRSVVLGCLIVNQYTQNMMMA
jgi:hypothetical protein